MVRIQLRRDTAANWTSSNPVLRAGEVGIETDTLKFKVGNGTSTWTQITGYANVTPSSLTSSLSAYIESGDLGQPSGPAQLTSGGDLLIPQNEIIMWSAETNTYTTTLIATEPTADRTITLKDGTGTLAFTSDIPSNTDTLSEGTTNKYFTDERAQDATATALANGSHTNITVTYNDSSNAISLAAAPGYVDEQAVDAVATALAAGTHTNVTVTYDDSGNSISLNASGGVSSLTGTANEVNVSSSTGAITVGLPDDVTITNNLTVTGDISAADSLQLTTNAAEASATGKLVWDDGEGVPAIGLKGGNVDLKIGSQEVALCYNGTGSTIAKGSVVYISGAQGQRPRISLSDADTEATSSKTFGVVAEAVADGAEGFVTTFGIVAGIDTSGFSPGDVLWLSSTAGGITTTKPSAPVHSVFVGYCLTAHASSGRIFVNPKNGYEIEELHNVAISSVANNDVLKYDSATQTWKNTKTLSITDLTLSGNLTVNGTTTTVNATDLVVSDPLIYIGEGNTANSVDLGFVASFNNGTYQHSGLVRDSSDNKWKLFKGVTDEPTTTINFAQGSLDDIAVAGITASSLTVGDVSNTEIGYLNGVTSAIQTQIDGKSSTGHGHTSADISDFAEAAQDAIGSNVGSGLAYTDSTGAIGINYVTLGDTLLDGVSGASYGLIGTSTYLDVKNTNGYNKEIELDIAAVETKLNTDGYLTTSSTSTLTNKTLTSPKINEDVALTATATELNYVDGVTSAIQTQLDAKVDESLFDTKGDLLVASADNTPAKLAVGTNGYLLTANSSATNGIEWAAAPVSLPSQSGESGKYLTTDGTTASWGTLVVPITTGTATITANTATTIDTNALSGFTSIEYMVSLKQGSKIRTSKVIVQTDGTSVDMTEFAITETGGTIAGVVISAAVSSTNAVLQVTATDAATTNVTVKFSEVKL